MSAMVELNSKHRPEGKNNQWLDSDRSVGVFYRKLGRYNCWEVVGPARETFDRISDEIKIYLKKNSDPIPYPVIWTMYMIGRLENTARPTIMFCSKDKNSRKRIRDEVEESGILNGYPGVGVGDADRPPDFDYLIPLALLEQCRLVSNSTNITLLTSSLHGYRLPPLHSPKWNFRLLEILPRKKGTLIKCRTVVVSLDKPPPFTVILGNFASSSGFTTPMIIADTSYDVSVEIVCILELICSKEYLTSVWIDQLCTDQSNFAERQDQLNMLPEIQKMAAKVLWPWEIQPERGEDTIVYHQTNDTSNSVFACSNSPNYFTLWKVTAGPIFWSKDKTYQTTISHGFHNTSQSMQDISARTAQSDVSLNGREGNGDSDYEYDIQDWSNAESDDEQLMDSTSRGSSTPEFMRSVYSDDTIASSDPLSCKSEAESDGLLGSPIISDKRAGKATSSVVVATDQHDKNIKHVDDIPYAQNATRKVKFQPSNFHLDPIGKVLNTYIADTSLDYTLIELDSTTPRPFNEITVRTDWKTTVLYPQGILKRPIDIRVLAVTGSTGIITGRLSGTPAFLQVPQSEVTQELWVVHLDGELKPGDSGSMVVDADNGNILGHIVSGSPKLGAAYIVPMYQILNDIKERSAIDLRLPGRNIPKPNEEDIHSERKMEVSQKDVFKRRQISRSTQTTLSIAPNSGTDSFSISALLWGSNRNQHGAMDNLSTQSTYVGSSNFSRITMAKDVEVISKIEDVGNQKFEHVRNFSKDISRNTGRIWNYLKHEIFSLPASSKGAKDDMESDLTNNTEIYSPWVLPVLVLSSRRDTDNQPIPMRAKCTIDTGNMQGNLVSKEFVQKVLELSESNFAPLTAEEKEGGIDVVGNRLVPEGAVYLTWYHNKSTRVFHNMRFLITHGNSFDLVIGARSIVKENLLNVPNLQPLAIKDKVSDDVQEGTSSKRISKGKDKNDRLRGKT